MVVYQMWADVNVGTTTDGVMFANLKVGTTADCGYNE